MKKTTKPATTSSKPVAELEIKAAHKCTCGNQSNMVHDVKFYSTLYAACDECKGILYMK